LRKFLVAAVAAMSILAAVGVASAQAPGADMTVKVAPKNAGTKAKPKDSVITLEIVNRDFSQTASRLEIWIPKSLKIDNKAAKKCSVAKLSAGGPAACPKASKIGGGSADARAGVNTSANPPVLPFKVTAFATGSTSIAFYLQQTNGSIVAVAPAKVKKASGKYSAKLDVSIPEEPAQQYPKGNYNGLERLETTLGTTKKGKSVIKSIGCTSKKHSFKAAIHFVPNPAPPKQAKVETTASAACSK
jgi:hypothetical protein